MDDNQADSLSSMLEVLAQQLALVAKERSGAEELGVAVRALVASQSELIDSQRKLMDEQGRLVAAQRDITEVQGRLLRHLDASNRAPLPRSEVTRNDAPPPAPAFADPDMDIASSTDLASSTADIGDVPTTRVHSPWPWSGHKA